MTNLLAILVSLAMLLTGATAPMAEPASRTLQVSGLTVRHNDEEVTLSPFVSLGTTTDGESALFDFFIGNGDDVYLPFQALADDNSLVVYNDNSNTTLKIDREQVDALLSQTDQSPESQELLGLMGDYMNAYGDLIRLMQDPDEMRAIQEKGEAVYGELVDRGEGVPGTLAADDEIIDVTNYEYDLTGAQIGALADALYASNDKLANYAQVYFRLLNAMPEDSGLTGLDSFEALLTKYDVLSMHVNESIAEDGLNVSDMILHITVPETEKPLEFVVHNEKTDETRFSEMSGDFNVEGTALTMYMEAAQVERDLQLSLTMVANPAEEAQEAEAPLNGVAGEGISMEEAEEADEEETEGMPVIVEADEDDEALEDGEGDIADAFYFTVDFDSSYDEIAGETAQSLSYALDMAANDAHMEFAIDGTMADAGEGRYQMSGELNVGAESYGFDLEANIANEPIEQRLNADEAVALDAFEPSVLMASVSADALNLYTDESVQKLIAMGQSVMTALSGTENAEAPADGAEGLDIGGETDMEDPGVLLFGNPQFTWLPEGFSLQNENTDTMYQDYNCSLVNEATGANLFIDISAAYADSTVNHYAIGEDGSLTAIDGMVLNEEISNGYSMYSMNNGAVGVSIFPSSDAIAVEDIARILSGLTFQKD